MASTSNLTFYTRAHPPAWGVVGLVGQITDQAGNEGVITVDYQDKAADANESVKLQSGSSSCNTPIAVIKSLAEAFASLGLCGANKAESEEIAKWISFAETNFSKTSDFQTVSNAADVLDHRLTLRSYIVGYKPTAADLALWGAAKSSSVFLGLLKRNQHPHLIRWYSYIESLPAVQDAVIAFLSAQKDNVKGKAKAANATFELGLPNAIPGKVVTRLPPEPSGYLHIGHAKAILNQHFARMYNGKFIVRYDDTNPSKEKAEFQQAIIEDLAMMGVHGDRVTYTSDYFDDLYKLAIEMIKRGKAYADDTPQEKMRAERMDGIPSERRGASVEESLARFAEMTTGSDEGKRWCLRAKISPDDPNKAMRDPVIYRCNPEPHHKTGDRWKVYPTYDFANPIVDCKEGISHCLRTNEYHDRNPQYWWMQDALDLPRVEIWDYGRINFVYTLLSKRKLKAMVEEKHLVAGWDDPRFPTVRGIRRRGMTVEALTQYMLAQGPSQAVTSLEWDGIWTANKKVIDPVAPRFTAVLKKDVVECTVTQEDGTPVLESAVAVPKHKKNLDVGNKTTTFAPKMYIEQVDAASFAPNEEVTFMDWGNAYVLKGSTNDTPIKSLDIQLHLAGDFKKTSKKVQWLAMSEKAPLVNVLLKDYDYLITKKKIEEDDDWTDFINPVTEFIDEAFADANVRSVKKGDIIQFERKGFYICDKDLSDDAKGVMEFIFIPDGKATSINLKAQPTKVEKPAKNTPGKVVQTTTAAPGLPDQAPTEATDFTLDSRGMPIPVKTKMYKVPSTTGNYQPVTQTKMHSVPSFTS